MSVLTPSRSPTKFRRAGSVAAWRKDPEVRLMLRVRDGDVTAFAELEARYRDRVLGWFCRRLGDRGEAEDLTQDVFLRLYRARASYRPRARFATWVFHITRNVARNALRSRRRRPWVRLDAAAPEPGLLEAMLPVRGDSPSRPMERDELAVVVRRRGRRPGRPSARGRGIAPVQGVDLLGGGRQARHDAQGGQKFALPSPQSAAHRAGGVRARDTIRLKTSPERERGVETNPLARARGWFDKRFTESVPVPRRSAPNAPAVRPASESDTSAPVTASSTPPTRSRRGWPVDASSA